MKDDKIHMDHHHRKSTRKHNELNLHEFGRYYSEKLNAEADALAEVYKDIPEPTKLNEWFNDYTKEMKKEEQRLRRSVNIKKYASRAAVVLLALLLSSAVVTMSVEAFRIRFLNLFIETEKDHNRIDFNESEEVLELPEGSSNDYYPTYLPEGYSLLDSQSGEYTKIATFLNQDNQLLIFTQNVNNMGVNIDNEHSDIELVPINDSEGYMTNKDGIISISWSENDVIFSLEGSEEIGLMIKIAKKIKKVSE
ncbi:DUF4367 domain-containing protein [Petrocella sp. FN5]|uniref:DUF4367 domain-containing protein n=1 Tax=Petrocella sp. FN5 TaxID=3032002 RepID=UPI0023DA6C45|nr:DUF4367 domain-containing protein [Petrocella sp. FN5]MDF1618626.1 DUF4367 domain-containing protein [Petrocella sp. FN5]